MRPCPPLPIEPDRLGLVRHVLRTSTMPPDIRELALAREREWIAYVSRAAYRHQRRVTALWWADDPERRLVTVRVVL